MRTAHEMYQYCTENGYGKGFSEKQALKHFALIEEALAPDETPAICFIGLHNYKSATEHDNNFAYAVTNKRILLAQKKVIGQTLQTISLNNINDITFSSRLVFGILTFDTIKETFNVCLDKASAVKLNKVIHDVLINAKQSPEQSAPAVSGSDPVEEIVKFKNLLDAGIITEEEFVLKKKQLLGL